jgi:cyclophilin family peptidyl-prolyl cis-trans isomerase
MTKFTSILCGLGLVLAFQANAPAQTITNQPQSTTNNNDSTATFTVVAGGATSYQWKFNTTNLNDGTLNDGVIISGSTNSTLTLEDITTNEAGSYTVVVSGSGPSATSSPAVLTITNGTIVRFILTGFPGGGSSNVDVQLFDHDKPATVENFIHYISAGAYTNMFFDRCLPEFVLQGGDDGATDQTNTNPPITGWDIASYTASNQFNPPFPAQVDSEFNVGPLIHNRFGTIAMALHPGEPNSATSAFFFNLADNSTNLDFQNGGFTVFGRILNTNTLNETAYSNVLAYFNTLANGTGIVTNGDFLDYGSLNTNQPFPNLPVNYPGNNAPANTHLVFCSFTNLTTLPVNTNLPTVSITNPAPNAVLTNGNPTIQGTATDDVGLADVICVLIPQAAADRTYPNGGGSITNYAIGTTNWSVNFTNFDDPYGLGLVPPGSYSLSVQSQNGAGYLSLPNSQPLTITAIVTNGNGTVHFTNSTSTSPALAVGYPFQDGISYNVLATAGANQLFVSWTASEGTNVNLEVPFTMFDGFVLTATFISNGIPNSIAFTSPEANAVLSSGTFNITGTISPPASGQVTVTNTIFSQTSGFSVSPPMTATGSTAWSVPVNNLPSGFYIVEVTAMDSANNTTVTNENFSVGVPLQLIILGDGTVSGVTNGEYLPVGTNFQVTATPASGDVFYAWNDGTELYTNTTETFTMSSNLTLTAEFVSVNAPKVISFTYPTANARLNTNSFKLKGRIASSVKVAQVTCQILSLSTYEEVVPPLTTTGTNTWSVDVTNLPPDEYGVEAVATYAGGKSTAIAEEFAVLDFKEVEGTYTGLFINGSVTPTNSGFFTVTVAASGAFSGRLLFPAYKPVPISGAFYPNGQECVFDVAGKGETTYPLPFPGNPAELSGMTLTLGSGANELTGTVQSDSGSWFSGVSCYRAVTKLSAHTTPPTGKYIFSLDPTGWSNTGYASLSVGGGGVLTLSGALPDGASFSQSARVATNGTWPLYVIPTDYKTSGMLMGLETWQTNGLGSYTGRLRWYKGPDIGTYYTSGINTNVNSTGTNYVRPAVGSYSIVFQAGTNSAPVTNDLTMLHAGGQFNPGTTTDKLAISLSANGIVTGHFVSATAAKPLQFKGAFFGELQTNSGFILDGDGQTGYFLLEPLGAP